jgi:hypothetical protein
MKVVMACEALPVWPAPGVPKDVVKLRNHGGKTYTQATVRDVFPKAEIVDGMPVEHRWKLRLDRAVFLDLKWAASKDVVDASYLVGDEEAATMEHRDNDCGEQL